MRVHALHLPPTTVPCASTGCARRGPRARRAARWRGRGIRAVDWHPAHGDSEGQNGRAGRRCSVKARQATWRSRPRTSRAPIARLGSRRAQERKAREGARRRPRRAKRSECVFRSFETDPDVTKCSSSSSSSSERLRYHWSFFFDDESADCDSSRWPGGGSADYLLWSCNSYVCRGVQCCSHCANNP